MADVFVGVAMIALFILGIALGWKIASDTFRVEQMIERGLYDSDPGRFLDSQRRTDPTTCGCGKVYLWSKSFPKKDNI